MLYALLVVLGLVVIGLFIVGRLEGLALLAPRSSKHIARSAEDFCTGDCRLEDGRCPMHVAREDCPLWRFVKADLPTQPHGSPFAGSSAGA